MNLRVGALKIKNELKKYAKISTRAAFSKKNKQKKKQREFSTIKDQRTVFRVAHNLVENKHKMGIFKPFYKVSYL